MTKTDVTQNIDILIGDDITKEVSDILIGNQLHKKDSLKVPANIKLSLDSQDSSIPQMQNDEVDSDEDLGRIFEDLDENKKDRKSDDSKKKQEDLQRLILADKGVGSKETATRKIDLMKVMESDEKKNNLHKATNSVEAKNVANGIKISAKIRNAMDMGDDDEDGKTIIIFNPNDLNNQLYNYIDAQEKNILQDKTIDQNSSLQGAEKLGAIHKANQDIKDMGLKIDKKEAGKTMLGSVNVNENKEKLVKKVIAKKLNIKTSSVKPRQTKQLVAGIKKIKAFGGKVDGMKASDAIKAGDKNTKDKEIAKIIYENATVKEKEKTAKNISKNISKDDMEKIVQKTGRGKDTKTKDIPDKEKQKIVKKELDNKNQNQRTDEILGKQMLKEKQREGR